MYLHHRNLTYPSLAPHDLRRYITHYKEMGHQRDTMEYCQAKEPHNGLVPLADYVQSHAVVREMEATRHFEAAIMPAQRAQRAGRVMGNPMAAHRRRRRRGEDAWLWDVSPRSLRSIASAPQVSLIRQERSTRETHDVNASCVLNVTFGGVYFQGRPHLWTARGCRGVFSCARSFLSRGSVLRCGLFIPYEHRKMLKSRANGREWLRFCSCDETESLEAARHWRDGRDHPANEAHSITVEYTV